MKTKIYRLSEEPKNRFSQNPAFVIVGSFFSMILVGAFLLTLPAASKEAEGTPFLSALFTATSATCVTGLSVYDIYTHFSLFGQAVIIGLIQLGGLGLVTLSTFFYTVIGKKMGLRTARLAKESVNADDQTDVRKLLRTIVLLTLSFEAAGAALMLPYFLPDYGSYGAFMALFFAISSYCNAGFDLLGILAPGVGMGAMFYAEGLHVIMSVLIICGGLGFVVWQDMGAYRKRRILLLHTRVVLICTGFLLVMGTLAIFFSEYGNQELFGDLPFYQKLFHSFYLSVSSRTAGFSTLDLSALSGTGKLVVSILMFIGVAPGSTGGGVKITSVVVIFMTLISVLRSRNETMILGRRVNKTTVYRSLSVILLGGLVVFLSAFVLYKTGDASTEMDALFEAISAFSTTGLSTGVTANTGVLSRIVLIVTMFLGRVGPLSFVLSFAVSEKRSHRVAPQGRIWVG